MLFIYIFDFFNRRQVDSLFPKRLSLLLFLELGVGVGEGGMVLGNFRCRGVLLIWIIVEPESTVLT